MYITYVCLFTHIDTHITKSRYPNVLNTQEVYILNSFPVQQKCYIKTGLLALTKLFFPHER